MLKRLSQIEFAIASVILSAIVLLVFVSAILRFFDHPVVWSVDVAQLLFIWLCMMGATRAMREKAHFGIDLLIRYLPPKARFGLELVLSAVVLVFLAALVVKGAELTTGDLQRRFGDSGISYAWVTSAVPVGSAMIGFALVHNMWRALRQRHAGEEELVYSRLSKEPDPRGSEL